MDDFHDWTRKVVFFFWVCLFQFFSSSEAYRLASLMIPSPDRKNIEKTPSLRSKRLYGVSAKTWVLETTVTFRDASTRELPKETKTEHHASSEKATRCVMRVGLDMEVIF
jgi:hypothetical protein